MNFNWKEWISNNLSHCNYYDFYYYILMFVQAIVNVVKTHGGRLKRKFRCSRRSCSALLPCLHRRLAASIQSHQTSIPGWSGCPRRTFKLSGHFYKSFLIIELVYFQSEFYFYTKIQSVRRRYVTNPRDAKLTVATAANATTVLTL